MKDKNTSTKGPKRVNYSSERLNPSYYMYGSVRRANLKS